MKLLYCPQCHDVVALRSETRSCACGKVFGRYTDGLNVDMVSHAVVLGINNASFREALSNIPEVSGLGERFETFIIPTNTKTVHRKNVDEYFDPNKVDWEKDHV